MYGKHDFSNHHGGIPIATCNFTIALVKNWGREVDGEFPRKPVHTEEYIREVYAAQDKELVRGNKPRYWEDEKVGEKLTPVVREPHTVMDTVSWIIGGIGEFYFCSNRLYRFTNEHTGWGTYDPDLKVYRNFHEDLLDANRGVGPMGSLRTSWIDMVLTNWMGDDGFLWKLSTSHIGIGMYGHVYWCKAEVIRKYNDQGRYCVDLDCWIEDHTGDVVTRGNATVLLPSRKYGPVNYPSPNPAS